MNRRRFLTVIAASGSGLLLSACDDIPASAVAPWQGPPVDERDIRVRALAWALLAPNPHNLQPWLADVRVADTITLSLDPQWSLPGTDPYGRQILIGCGGFVELLRMAAAQEGYAAQIAWFPEGVFGERLDTRPFARITLVRAPSVPPDPLFAYVRKRRTNRAPYEARAVDAAAQRRITVAIDTPGVRTTFSADAAQTQRISALAADGYRVEWDTPSAFADSARVIRLGADAIAAEPSGIAVHGTAIWWGLRFGMVGPEDVADSRSSGAQQGLARVIAAVEATTLWVWQTTADDSRAAQIAAGRAYLRLDLAAAAAGVAIHPNSQTLQEFPEMQPLYAEMHRALGVSPPQRVQMLARLGYAPPAGPAPRRPVQKLLRS